MTPDQHDVLAVPAVGLGYRRPLRSWLQTILSDIDCLEVTTEQFIPVTRGVRAELSNLAGELALLPHGLSLSIGSVERPPQPYLDDIARVLEIIEAPYYTDHFAITRSGGKTLGHLSPIWYTEESLEQTINNIRSVQEFLGVPLVLETITEPFRIPGSTMAASEFIASACAETGCGVLLDVTNVFINAHTFKEDPRDFVDQLPSSAIRHVHLAGYGVDPDTGALLDSHAHDIQDEVWRLFAHALAKAHPEAVIIERDNKLNDISGVHADLKTAREIVSRDSQ